MTELTRTKAVETQSQKQKVTFRENRYFRLASNDILWKVNRQLKIPLQAVSAVDLTVQRSIWFFFAARSENKKLLGVFLHFYSDLIVPSRNTDKGSI